ncbi:MAG TPA: serine hydrolase domain-containing protein, partial [Terriglobia bacterium]|nr:serine hydrolase domain-containing protein [Terriglobia bacterium]
MSLTRRTFFSVTGRLISVALVGCARTQPAWETSIASLEGRITELMKKLRVPGVSIAIVRDAQIAWTNSFGVRDTSTGAAVDDGTIFSAQSMSKPVFAYRVMKLCEQGVLDLDAPLTDYTS